MYAIGRRVRVEPLGREGRIAARHRADVIAEGRRAVRVLYGVDFGWPREFWTTSTHLVPLSGDDGSGRCGEPLSGARAGEEPWRCGLDANHRGRCSSSTYECDHCLRRRRNDPAYQGMTYDGEEFFRLCGPCRYDPGWTPRERARETVASAFEEAYPTAERSTDVPF